MNFQKSWDIDFQKFLECDIFLNLKNLKFLKILVELCFDLILDYRFCVVDIVDIVDIVVVLVELLKTSEKAFIFLYSKYIILRIIGERERDFIVIREIF